MSKKNICFLVTNIFDLGGVQRVVSVIANEFVKNYNVTIVCVAKNVKVNRDIYKLNSSINVEIKSDLLYMNSIKKACYKALKTIHGRSKVLDFVGDNFIEEIYYPKSRREKLFNYLSQANYDLVIGVEGYLSLLLGSIANRLSSRTIGWQHNSYEAYLKNKNRYYWKQDSMFKKYISNLDKFVVLTNHDKDMYAKEMNLDVEVIYNPKSFTSKEKSDLSKKQFLAAGRFTYQKGFDLLIESFKEFSKYNDDWNLVIVGEGEEKEKIISLINKYNLQNRIRIDSFTDNIKKYFLESSVLLLPSRWEGMPMIVLESLEMGVPVISYDITAVEALLKNNFNGIIVEKNNVNKFSNAMIQLARDYESRNKLSRNCIEKSKMFEINNISEQWIKVLKEL